MGITLGRLLDQSGISENVPFSGLDMTLILFLFRKRFALGVDEQYRDGRCSNRLRPR